MAPQPFAAVARVGTQYLTPRKKEDVLGWNVDEIWLFGTPHTSGDDMRLYHALQASAAARGAIVHWMPLPRKNLTPETFEQNYCVSFNENFPRR